MKAILTKYHGPTNTKGSRISARAEGEPRRFYSYNPGSSDPHRDAAIAFISEAGWGPCRVYGGTLPSGDKVWVMGYAQDSFAVS